MNSGNLEGKKCLVIGAGVSGIWAARLLAAKGAEVTLNDHKTLDHLELHEVKGVTLAGGGHGPELFEGQDLIVLSPGVPTESQPLCDLLARAEKGGAEVISEIELGSRYVTVPIIAITGTNGKSTTTTLLADMLELGGRKVFSGGNLGTPLCQFLLSGDKADILVLEVSSFQLERIRTFRPFIAIMLNITADHLDRYRSMDEYIEAKAKIFMNQQADDYAVINGEDRIIRKLTSRIAAEIIPFGPGRQHRSGLYLNDTSLVSGMAGHKALFDGALLNGMGRHNLDNVMASVAAALLCNVPVRAISQAIDSYVGLPHRMEHVADLCGVSFYDDSKATNVGALVKSLATIEGKVVLIAGGKDKGGSYGPLKKYLRKKARALVLIGEAAQRMEDELGGTVTICRAGDMVDAVTQAWRLAKEGDRVLLSPACSSFDMFSGYAERGDVFKAAVAGVVARMEDNHKEHAVAR